MKNPGWKQEVEADTWKHTTEFNLYTSRSCYNIGSSNWEWDFGKVPEAVVR